MAGGHNHNSLIPDPQKFSSDINALADYLHNKGLKLGIYSDAATQYQAGEAPRRAMGTQGKWSAFPRQWRRARHMALRDWTGLHEHIRKNARYWKGQVNSHETVLLVLQYYKYDNYHICQVVHIP